VDSLDAPYVLDEQVGFLLRQATQRHVAIFADRIGDDITPTQFAALAKLREQGPCSQNLLGRHTGMDVATIKGVIDRLTRRGLTSTRADPDDARRLIVFLTPDGTELVDTLIPRARAITRATLAPLSAEEQRMLYRLLRKLR
jgi:DNA-binding MarR family transcriptional regulator